MSTWTAALSGRVALGPPPSTPQRKRRGDGIPLAKGANDMLAALKFTKHPLLLKGAFAKDLGPELPMTINAKSGGRKELAEEFRAEVAVKEAVADHEVATVFGLSQGRVGSPKRGPELTDTGSRSWRGARPRARTRSFDLSRLLQQVADATPQLHLPAPPSCCTSHSLGLTLQSNEEGVRCYRTHTQFRVPKGDAEFPKEECRVCRRMLLHDITARFAGHCQ